MNFERMIDSMLAGKIKKARKSLKMTQEQFCEKYEIQVSIDKYRLSNLENGRRNKKKNPHFLTESYIEFFADLLGLSTKEFLFGIKEDKERFVKLILLNIFMNGDTQSAKRDNPQIEQSPIFDINMSSDKEFFRLAMLNLDGFPTDSKLAGERFHNHESVINKQLKEERRSISATLIAKDSFFYSAENASLYSSLMNGEQIFSEQSSIILKCLFGNFDFASSFLNRIDNEEHFRFDESEIILRDPRREQFYIDNYLSGKGYFSANAINWKETDFILFIKAFNGFFKYNSEKLLSFFEQKIFCKTLKQLSNTYVNSLFSSREFTDLLNNIYLKDQFILERMTGHNFARAKIQKFSLIMYNSKRLRKDEVNFLSSMNYENFYDISSLGEKEDKYTLTKYLYDFENMTGLFASKEHTSPPYGLYLPSYFEITNLK